MVTPVDKGYKLTPPVIVMPTFTTTVYGKWAHAMSRIRVRKGNFMVSGKTAITVATITIFFQARGFQTFSYTAPFNTT